ncbi:hypothetical protein ACU6T4_11610 [Avibacterium paragallinarum]|uniref:hypothetical protein n=2 Tax=Avibacterium paragallinarum TaxID=728 RepID=UPI00021AD3AC|nr:hypothetical protein [Avibacterium paragallinarum]AZI13565.1 hypothetical protein EIA51_02265 [Avibacterium paragallinarum]QIR10892.1 hypothetical protein HBL79_00645 [Avibacterium paragallinarum]QJE10261.1 hypothetical protein HHJ62_08170 [Avibacterium paragallinarum]QJE12455.1 hypothetical protein HHJ61_08180 [Avibacterium paragallinarum]QJE14658.1 hypothetical protein HHJ60_08195 [Avibacterium paragallinarum]
MARNKLTRSAKPIADRVMEKYYKQKQCEIAEAMETTPSTVSRFVSNGEGNNTFNFIAANGFDVFDTQTHIALEKSELELLLLAAKGFDDRLRKKYLK